MNVGLEFRKRAEVAFFDLGAPPEPEGDEVLIDTHYTAITNGTERHALLGEHAWKGAFPSQHGYQHVGTITAVGDGVEDFQVGDWVFCGRYMGHRSWNIHSTGDSDPDRYDSHLIVPLPEGIPRDTLALLGVAGVAMRAVRRLRIEGSQKVWIAGAGLIGLFAVQIVSAMGAEVTVTDLLEKRLELAAKLGAHNVLDASRKDYLQDLKKLGPFDSIIDLCGADEILPAIGSSSLIAYQGVIGLIAVRSETCFQWEMVHGTEASIEVSCHFSILDLEALIDLVLSGQVEIEPLISHREPIRNALQIYSQLRDDPSSLLGVIFDWK